MIVKEGVQLHGLKIEMRTALMTAARIWKQFGQELVVTSALDGTHAACSLHYYGYALDFRSRYFTEEEKTEVINLLRKKLPKEFEVISHPTHIHVEYDLNNLDKWN